MGWLRLVGSFKAYVSFAKEPYKRDDILQKRPIILRRLLIVATPYLLEKTYIHTQKYKQTHACTHTHTHTHTHAHAHAHTHTHTHTRTHTYTQTHSHTHTLTHIH